MSNTKNIQFNNINLEFIQCPAGSFTMGSSNGLPLELPVRQVKIENPFWISTTLVTQALWTEVMPGNPSRFTGSGNLPVDSISYDAALAFCEAANVNYAVQFRLPTEAEWEYACRAGTMTEYFWGASSADALKYGWFDMNAQEQTHPVAELAPNPWGLYDVVGNLWEW
ncbi:MAG: formylglycine-generating enzyme family protein, partial [Gammaproteobacteria bacterium]|nr:formylglycine-generating enzyme family protein [Gammaproteobacteria bacterium]